jgi:hypothetical protein
MTPQFKIGQWVMDTVNGKLSRVIDYKYQTAYYRYYYTLKQNGPTAFRTEEVLVAANPPPEEETMQAPDLTCACGSETFTIHPLLKHVTRNPIPTNDDLALCMKCKARYHIKRDEKGNIIETLRMGNGTNKV